MISTDDYDTCQWAASSSAPAITRFSEPALLAPPWHGGVWAGSPPRLRPVNNDPGRVPRALGTTKGEQPSTNDGRRAFVEGAGYPVLPSSCCRPVVRPPPLHPMSFHARTATAFHNNNPPHPHPTTVLCLTWSCWSSHSLRPGLVVTWPPAHLLGGVYF